MDTKQNLSFPIIIELDEDNVFIVSCPSFKGCHSYGHTIDEAMQNIREAIELCLEDETNLDLNNQYIGVREINIKNPNYGKLVYA